VIPKGHPLFDTVFKILSYYRYRADQNTYAILYTGYIFDS